MLLSKNDRLHIAFEALREWGAWARGGMPPGYQPVMPEPLDTPRKATPRRFTDEELLKIDRIVSRQHTRDKKILKMRFISRVPQTFIVQQLGCSYYEIRRAAEKICEEFIK